MTHRYYTTALATVLLCFALQTQALRQDLPQNECAKCHKADSVKNYYATTASQMLGEDHRSYLVQYVARKMLENTYPDCQNEILMLWGLISSKEDGYTERAYTRDTIDTFKKAMRKYFILKCNEYSQLTHDPYKGVCIVNRLSNQLEQEINSHDELQPGALGRFNSAHIEHLIEQHIVEYDGQQNKQRNDWY